MSTYFYEVEVKNRVIKGMFHVKRIYGTQGTWHHEQLYFIAKSEQEAQAMATDHVKKRKIIGVSERRKGAGYLRREVKILNTRRIA